VGSAGLNYSPGQSRSQPNTGRERRDAAGRHLALYLSLFQPGRNQLVAEPRIWRTPVAIDGKRNDRKLVVRLADLRLQEIPIGAFLIVRTAITVRSTRDDLL